MKDLSKQRYSDVHRDNIIRYLEAGGERNALGIVLSDKDQELLDRWRRADEIIRKNKYKRHEIADLLVGQYGISKDTAWRDIVNAEYVFSSSYPHNRKYMIGVRMEFLNKVIQKAYEDEDYEAVARLEKELREYIKMYPESTQKRSPKTIIYNIQNNLLQVNVAPREALSKADTIIQRIEEHEDY